MMSVMRLWLLIVIATTSIVSAMAETGRDA
jgi:hypothetical protein